MACLTFAAAHPLEDIAQAQPRLQHLYVLIHSPWPTDPPPAAAPDSDAGRDLCAVWHATEFVAGSLHLQDEDSSGKRKINERPQTHAYRVKIHGAGGRHAAPFATRIRVIREASSTPSIQAHPKRAPPCVYGSPIPPLSEPYFFLATGTSPATCALVPWDSSLWPYPRAPLDDIGELHFADPGDLSDFDAFRTATAEQKNVAKDRAKERERSNVRGDANGVAVTKVTTSAAIIVDQTPYVGWLVDRLIPHSWTDVGFEIMRERSNGMSLCNLQGDVSMSACLEEKDQQKHNTDCVSALDSRYHTRLEERDLRNGTETGHVGVPLTALRTKEEEGGGTASIR
ncbi:hypothetical protein F5148DRAFT_1369802 [Russula earlei]|uniref:Uncharacterized protein n=1 Tax=Russula earlei TaxID=71964 RepID=A0ACC0U088_9AGAM|nr:hypothetical protein F5148DRAFT_1369802 [Russula earlei]